MKKNAQNTKIHFQNSKHLKTQTIIQKIENCIIYQVCIIYILYILSIVYICIYVYKASNPTLGPTLLCQSFSTRKRPFRTPIAKPRRITIYTHQMPSLKAGFRPKIEAWKKDVWNRSLCNTS